MKFLYYTILCILLSSCYQEIDLEKERKQEGENILTLNSIINPDSKIQAFATKTYFYPDGHAKPIYIENLDIELWINNEFIQLLNFNDSIYEANIFPKETDAIELRTQYLNASICACDIVPKQTKIENTTTSVNKIYNHVNGDYKFEYNITFTDDPNETNYYFFRLSPHTILYTPLTSDLIFSEEPVFQQLNQEMNDVLPGWELSNAQMEHGLPFSDKTINGKTHTLHICEIPSRNLLNLKTMVRKFELFSISENYYKYLTDVLRTEYSDGISGGLIDIGAVEPIKIFTNIEGGTGILGSYSSDFQVVNVYKDSHFEELYEN